MTESQSPAGWYPDPRTPGRTVYWDGSRWTGHYHDAAPPPPPPAPVSAQPPAQLDEPPALDRPAPDRPALWKSPYIIAAVLGIAAIGIIAALTAGSGSTTTTSSNDTPAAVATGEPVTKVTIVSPRSNARVQRTVAVRGTVSPPNTPVLVGIPGERISATVIDGRWAAKVKIDGTGILVIQATAGTGSGQGSASVDVERRPTKAEIEADKRRIARQRELARQAREEERQAFRDDANPIDYGEVSKDPNAHIGEKVKLYGQIFQIQQEAGTGFMLLAVTDQGYDIWDDNVWVDYSGSVKADEEDLVTVYGTITGAKDYDTQIGGSTTVPQVQAEFVDEDE